MANSAFPLTPASLPRGKGNVGADRRVGPEPSPPGPLSHERARGKSRHSREGGNPVALSCRPERSRGTHS